MHCKDLKLIFSHLINQREEIVIILCRIRYEFQNSGFSDLTYLDFSMKGDENVIYRITWVGITLMYTTTILAKHNNFHVIV